jgi:hypothetical protein
MACAAKFVRTASRLAETALRAPNGGISAKLDALLLPASTTPAFRRPTYSCEPHSHARGPKRQNDNHDRECGPDPDIQH